MDQIAQPSRRQVLGPFAAAVAIYLVFWLHSAVVVTAFAVAALCAHTSLVSIVAVGAGLAVVAGLLWVPTAKPAILALKSTYALMWLTFVMPTFGIVPILIASQLLYRTPGGFELHTYAGFALTSIYVLAYPAYSTGGVDHPFPPLSDAQLGTLGGVVMVLSSSSIYGIWNHLRWALGRHTQSN